MDIDLPRNLPVMAVFFLTPAFLFTAFMVDAAGPPIVPLDSHVGKHNIGPLDDPFFAGNPTFHPEKSVPIQLVLNMLGASTFKAVMEQRRTSNGANSANIVVAFSIPNCDPSDPFCTNEDFNIFDESATNFTVEARLVVNEDLNHVCEPADHKGRVGYVKYPGHEERPNGTAEFTNYFVVYKCGTFLKSEFLAANSSDGVAYGWPLAVVCFAVIFALLACFYHRRKNATPPAPEGIQLNEINPPQQNLVPADETNAQRGGIRLPNWLLERMSSLGEMLPTWVPGRNLLIDSYNRVPSESNTQDPSSAPAWSSQPPSERTTLSTDAGSSSDSSSGPSTSSNNPGPSTVVESVEPLITLAPPSDEPSGDDKEQPTTPEEKPEQSPSEDEPKEEQSSAKTSESDSTEGAVNKAYQKSDSTSSGSDGKEEPSK